MKITNKDICDQLKEIDGQNWKFGYGWFVIDSPCFYVKGKSVNDMCHEYNTQIPLKIWYSKFDENLIWSHFDELDWGKVYKESVPKFDNHEKRECKTYEHKDENFEYKLVFTSERLEKAVQMALEKKSQKAPQKAPQKAKPDNGRDKK